MMRYKKIEATARTVPVESIQQLVDDQFAVRSLTNPSQVYQVDLEAYTCDCLSYPMVLFCHHLGAVQLHFGENLKIRPFKLIFTLPDSSVSDSSSSKGITKAGGSENAPDACLSILASIPNKLQCLAMRMQLSPPQHLSNNLQELDSFLNWALRECAQPQVLPKQKKLPPNQHSWPETRTIMGADQKTKRKSLHNDPYSGGERSGKKAKADARVLLASNSKARCVYYMFIPTRSVDY